MTEEPLLAVENLRARRGNVEVVFDFNLSVDRGESVAVLGPNGAGKSTSIDAISGLAQKAGGSVVFDGCDVTDWPPHRIARSGLVQVSQDRDLFPLMSVGDNLLLGGHAARHGEVRRDRLDDLLNVFPILRDRWAQRANSLSGGEQQMLAIARSLVSGPRLVLLDEPSAGLAPSVIDSLIDLLRDVARDELTLVLTEQNVEISLALCSTFVVVRNGRTVFTGDRPSLGRDPQGLIASLYMDSNVGETHDP